MPLHRHTLRLPRAIRATLAVFTVAGLVTGLAGAGSAGAAPSPAAPARPDLVLAVSSNPAEVHPAGGIVQVAIAVRNAGSAPAEDVTVKVRPPAGATPAPPPEPGAFAAASAEGEGDPGWVCDGQWRCTYGTIEAGGAAEALTIRLRLPAGTLGDVVTVSATASTSSHETSTIDNTAKAKVTYTSVADLAVRTVQAEPTDVSNLGDRTFFWIVIANDGTTDAADVRVTLDAPSGAWVQEPFDPFEWQCDFASTPWVCTRGALTPISQPDGLHAVLNLPVMLPAGTTGDTTTISATVSTTSPERSLANNRGEVTLRYVTPEPADLQVIDMAVSPQQVVAGDRFHIGLQVENVGGSPADDVKVRVPLPDTVEPVSADLTGPDWTCSVVTDPATRQRAWECAHPRYEPHSIEYLSRIVLTVSARGGAPDGTLSFVATARTASPEISTDNNTAEASTTDHAQGFISGRVWTDRDRDGQRDPDEPRSAAEGTGSSDSCS